MSVEDDIDNLETELRDLVSQTLQENGVLCKVKAQLRAGLYLALENEIDLSENHPNSKSSLKCKLKNPNLGLIFSLVKEFLDYFELQFTNTVFEQETFLGLAYEYKGREELIKTLDLGLDSLYQAPLLLEILNIARSNLRFKDEKIHFSVNDDKDLRNMTYDISEQSTCQLNRSVETSISSNVSHEVPQPIIDIKTVRKDNLNETFGKSVSSDDSRGSIHEDQKVEQSVQDVQNECGDSPRTKDEGLIEPDDTYEGTSSIAEDSVLGTKESLLLIDFDKTLRYLQSSSTPNQSQKNLLDKTIEDTPRSSKVVLSPENLSSSSDRKHVKDKTEKTEKLKPMSGLSCLADLPSLQVKPRNSDTMLLPSLYSKEFREKSSLKEVDKMLLVHVDSLDNYEEDVMSDGVDLENNILNESKSDETKNEDCKRSKCENQEINDTLLKEHDQEKSSDFNLNMCSDKNNILCNSQVNAKVNSADRRKQNETSSISEDFDLNSNLDDLLKSDNSI